MLADDMWRRKCRQKDTALHWAAFKGHAEVVQALLQAGANPVSSFAHWNFVLESLCCHAVSVYSSLSAKSVKK